MPSNVCVVVHPSRIFREGLTSILARSPFEPTYTLASVEDVPRNIASAGEQVLLLIGIRKGGDLAEALRAAKAHFPDAHLVVIGDSCRRDLVTTALELGATSFVDENTATLTLPKELELVALGEPVVSVFILKQLLRHCSAPYCSKEVVTPALEVLQPPDIHAHVEQKPQLCAIEIPPPLDTHAQAERKVLPFAVEAPQVAGPEQNLQLSAREAAILNALVQGASNKLIAYQLKITEATVKVHVKAILRKIHVKNRTQAAIWAVNRQVLPKNLGAEEIPAHSSQPGAMKVVRQ
jgi:two-component system nitrate/nitrite response regulator NarL